MTITSKSLSCLTHKLGKIAQLYTITDIANILHIKRPCSESFDIYNPKNIYLCDAKTI